MSTDTHSYVYVRVYVYMHIFKIVKPKKQRGKNKQEIAHSIRRITIRELQAGSIRQRSPEGVPSELRPVALVLCRAYGLWGRTRKGQGSEERSRVPRAGGWLGGGCHESRDWQDRPGHEASGSLFQSSYSRLRTEVYCMVFSRDGTRSESHFIVICHNWRGKRHNFILLMWRAD